MEFRNIVVEYKRKRVYIYIVYSVHRKPLIASLSAPDQRTSMKLSNRHWYSYYPLPFKHRFNESKDVYVYIYMYIRDVDYNVEKISFLLFFFFFSFLREEKFGISA